MNWSRGWPPIDGDGARENSMLKVISDVHWLAVLVAGVAHFVLGGAWFMGLVGKHYGAALGRDDLQGQKPAPLAIVGPFVCSLVVIATSAVLLRALSVTSGADGALFGLVIGVGYLTPMVVNIAINPNFPRPFFYGLINAPFFILGSVLSCSILVAMS
jgi:hypothetical protein